MTNDVSKITQFTRFDGMDNLALIYSLAIPMGIMNITACRKWKCCLYWCSGAPFLAENGMDLYENPVFRPFPLIKRLPPTEPRSRPRIEVGQKSYHCFIDVGL